MLRLKLFIYFTFLLLCFRVSAQDIGVLPLGLVAGLEAGKYISPSKMTPFWLRTNQFGIVPTSGSAAQIQGSIRKDYVFFDSLSNCEKKMDWGFVGNPIITYNTKRQVNMLMPEAHLKARFKMLEIYVGRRREVIGLGDSTLSSGFYAGSGNAMPIPKVQIGTVTFAPLKFTANFLAVHAGIAHGWFKTDYIQGVRLHQKFIYFRLGKVKSKSKLYFGLNHNVLWAGHSEELKKYPELALDGQLPSSWKFFPNVVLAYTSKNWYTKNGYGSFDSYRLGNHLGSYDIAIEMKWNNNNLFIYHQHPFEDVSSMLFKNVPDGLYGINLKVNPLSSEAGFKLKRLTLEFLTTKDQSGSKFYIPGSNYQGADNYFNHSQYMKGWSYLDRTLGTPFIVPRTDLGTQAVNGRYFPNNRVNVWYAGAQASRGNDIFIAIKVSYSQNFGTPSQAFNEVRGQLSTYVVGEYKLWRSKKVTLVARLALDNGDFLVNSGGGYFGIRKIW
ncbi:capsule assembly Wzi family protein [Dyadobacter sp. CY347]|uniref:capsule assembly Wzi family protein n=1 Tax=Dyadobacter sp. CY347 TaxID=2909336 RepID=UPI001F3736CB|nr:capsule assembly Wzi family protein [Dyadobacter sp. CY347]MCF2491444.1 capsule assembly Wzi family protein [Dyadobacter sp. CY347]